MISERERFIKRIKDMASRSYQESRYLFTDFLAAGEISDLMGIPSADIPCGYSLYGGYDGAERLICRFGSAEQFGYEEDYPITIVHIFPSAPKFSEDLTHRDYLGAIVNLGIDRRVTGDILVSGKDAYLICNEEISGFICENLSRVRHTQVKLEIVSSVPDVCLPQPVKENVLVASERLDVVVAHVYNLSRNSSLELFRSEKISVNGRCMIDPAIMPHADDMISVRGYGRFRYIGCDHITRKGKLSISLERYV